MRRAYQRHKLTCAGFRSLMHKLFRQDWVVYAKPAFGGPEAVLRYFGRYTHPVAISNHRLTAFDGERVTFRWKDYAHGNQQRLMTLHGHCQLEQTRNIRHGAVGRFQAVSARCYCPPHRKGSRSQESVVLGSG